MIKDLFGTQTLFAAIASLITLTVLSSTTAAWAYIPPSPFIIKTMAGKKANLKNMRLRSVVMGYENEKPSPTLRFKVTTLYQASSQTLQSWAMDETDRKLYEVERSAQTLTPVDRLLLTSNIEELTRSLRARKIPVVQTGEAEIALNLRRWKSTFAWTMGATDGVTPGLWIEKDTFLPLRAVLARPVDEQIMDIQFEAFRSIHELSIPRVITIAKAGSPAILRDELSEAVVNQDERNFKLAPHFNSGFTDLGNQTSSALRDLIQQYYLTLR